MNIWAYRAVITAKSDRSLSNGRRLLLSPHYFFEYEAQRFIDAYRATDATNIDSATVLATYVPSHLVQQAV